jgi:Flp pilus assembly protein TadD
MGHFEVLIMEPRDIDAEKIRAPLLRRRNFVLFLDDLQRFAQLDIESMCETLRNQSELFLSVATCRSGKELNALKEDKLTFYREFVIVELEDIDAEDAKRFAADAGLPWRPECFDGTPGSITLDLEDVRLKYRNAGDGKPVLKALKLLNRANSYIYDQSCVRDVCEHVFEIPRERLSKHSWDEMLVCLRDNHLISLSGDAIDIYQPYLDICIDDYDPPSSDLNRLRRMFVSLSDSRSLLRLGLSFCSTERFKDASNCYREAIRIQPEYWPTRTYLGYALTRWGEAEEQRGRNDKAARLYQAAWREHREALRIDDGFNRAFGASQRYVVHRNLAYVLAKLGQMVEAEHEYREALDLKPNDPATQTCLAYLLSRLHRYDEAETQLRQTIAGFPEYAVAYVNLAYVLSSRDKYAEAAEVAEAAVTLKSDCAEAYNAIGYALTNLGQYTQAESRYLWAVELNPSYVEACNNLAYLHAKLNHHERAVEQYSKSLEICPTDADALIGLAISLEHLGKNSEAEEKYRNSIAMDPRNAKIRKTYAVFLERRGRREEALIQYEAIVEACPTDSDASDKAERLGGRASDRLANHARFWKKAYCWKRKPKAGRQ